LRLDDHAAELGRDVQITLLRDDEPVAIGGVKGRLVLALVHVLVESICEDAKAVLHGWLAGAAHLEESLNKVDVLTFLNLERLPSFLSRI